MTFYPLSALQHLLFCERQCALIHAEREWADNALTVEGSHLHEKVDSGASSPSVWYVIAWHGCGRPPRGGRGLKPFQSTGRVRRLGSPPAWGAWIETA